MRVLQVLPRLNLGGVERGCVDIAQALAEGGHASFTASSGGMLAEKLRRGGSAHIALPLHTKNPLVMVWNMMRLVRLIKDLRIELVHVRSRAPAWSSVYAARLAGVPCLTTFHGTYNFKNRLKKAYNAIMLKGVCVIAPSRFIRDHIVENYIFNRDKIIVIHRGIDLKDFDPISINTAQGVKFRADHTIPLEATLITLPGRLARWKGHLLLLQAFLLLPGPIKGKIHLCFVGIGKDIKNNRYGQEILAYIKRHNLSSKVSLIPHCAAMPLAYAASDLIVSPSTDPEAFGRTMAEGQAMGKVVIASNHGGAIEIIKDNETGWLVPPRDRYVLAEKIGAFMALPPSLRKKMESLARDHVSENFSLEGMCKKTLAVYARIIADNKF